MKIAYCIAGLTSLFAAAQLFASNTPIFVTGFNADEVAENDSNHYAGPIEGHPIGISPAFFESGLDGHLDGLPSSKSFTSIQYGTLFTLQSYGSNGVPSNNALRLFDGAIGTLTLSTPVQLLSLSILAMTASGTGGSTHLALTVTFTDGSTLGSTYSAPDWVATGNAIGGLGRGTSGTAFTYDSNPNTFGMTETLIDLSSTTKLVKSLTFTGANDFTTYTTTSIFAISGTAVPEPATWSLLALGVVTLLCGLRLCPRKPTRKHLKGQP